MAFEEKDDTVVTYPWITVDILSDAFHQICSKSDVKSLDLTNFICGLIQFGINKLSNKQMENIFNLMDINNKSMINEYNFITFLTANFKQIHTTNHKLQTVLLNAIKQRYKNTTINYNNNINKTNKINNLTASEFIEYSYIPLNPTNKILEDNEKEINKLKLQLKEAINTLQETIETNAEHIGENEQVITEIKYSLFKHQKEEEAQEILIESSLEPTTNYNPFEWNINDIIDWLQMCNLQHYIDITKINQINGNQLLTWNKEELIHNFELKQNDINKFIQEIEILKETAPQIYDPNNVSVSSESDISCDNKSNLLQETSNVTEHTFAPKQNVKEEIILLKNKIELQQNIISKINEKNNIQIDKLKDEINRIELSKIELIINTSSELQKLRDVINYYKIQI